MHLLMMLCTATISFKDCAWSQRGRYVLQVREGYGSQSERSHGDQSDQSDQSDSSYPSFESTKMSHTEYAHLFREGVTEWDAIFSSTRKC